MHSRDLWFKGVQTWGIVHALCQLSPAYRRKIIGITAGNCYVLLLLFPIQTVLGRNINESGASPNLIHASHHSTESWAFSMARIFPYSVSWAPGSPALPSVGSHPMGRDAQGSSLTPGTAQDTPWHTMCLRVFSKHFLKSWLLFCFCLSHFHVVLREHITQTVHDQERIVTNKNPQISKHCSWYYNHLW